MAALWSTYTASSFFPCCTGMHDLDTVLQDTPRTDHWPHNSSVLQYEQQLQASRHGTAVVLWLSEMQQLISKVTLKDPGENVILHITGW